MHDVKISVVGSINMDLVVEADRFPKPGETVMGGALKTFPGGKGANQAVAAAKLGATVHLIGRVGKDANGQLLRDALDAEGVITRGVDEHGSSTTGVAVITVTPDGENTIVVAPGANATLGATEVAWYSGLIEESDALILQLETTMDAVARAAEIAHWAKTRVILNAAPAAVVPNEILKLVDILIVNQTEAMTMTGTQPGRDGRAFLDQLLRLGPSRVVLTLGAQGAVFYDGQVLEQHAAFPVEAIDATAAGDAFVGAYAVQGIAGADAREALRYGCAAGALTTTKRGAQPSLPNHIELEDFLKSHGA